ncbi:MAG: hypothetical protein AAF310_04370 [Myxococcota bacterium]
MMQIEVDPNSVIKACYDCGKQGLLQGFAAGVALTLLIVVIGRLLLKRRDRRKQMR